jgi:hypothetical protein
MDRNVDSLGIRMDILKNTKELEIKLPFLFFSFLTILNDQIF